MCQPTSLHKHKKKWPPNSITVAAINMEQSASSLQSWVTLSTVKSPGQWPSPTITAAVERAVLGAAHRILHSNIRG